MSDRLPSPFNRAPLAERIAQAKNHMHGYRQHNDALWPHQQFALTLGELLDAAEAGLKAADEIDRLRAELQREHADHKDATAIADGCMCEIERLRAALAAQQAPAPVIGYINPAPHAAAPLVNSPVAYVSLTPGTAAQQAQGEPLKTGDVAWMRVRIDTTPNDGGCFATPARHPEDISNGYGEWNENSQVYGCVVAAPAAPAGWQLVPVEPTAAMQRAALYASRTNVACGMTRMLTDGCELWASEQVYRAMLAAAPTHTGDAPETMTRG